MTRSLTPTLSRKREREQADAVCLAEEPLTPALSRKREREQADAVCLAEKPLTPTLSRKRERGRADVSREIADQCSQVVGAELTYPLSRVRERVGVRVDAKAKARDLRARTTEAETLLWQQLRGRRFQNFKFRRQRALGPYILDFICLEAGLVIEVDGGQHGEQQVYDQARTALIETHGLVVIRFWNHEVMNEMSAVLEKIWQTLQTLTPALSRTRERGQDAADFAPADSLTPALSRMRERGQTAYAGMPADPHPTPLLRAGEGVTPESISP